MPCRPVFPIGCGPPGPRGFASGSGRGFGSWPRGPSSSLLGDPLCPVSLDPGPRGRRRSGAPPHLRRGDAAGHRAFGPGGPGLPMAGGGAVGAWGMDIGAFIFLFRPAVVAQAGLGWRRDAGGLHRADRRLPARPAGAVMGRSAGWSLRPGAVALAARDVEHAHPLRPLLGLGRGAVGGGARFFSGAEDGGLFRDRRAVWLRRARPSARRGTRRGWRGCMRCIQAASGPCSKLAERLWRQRVRPFSKRPANGWMGRLFSSPPLSVWGGIWAFRAHPLSQGSIFHDGLASPASAVAGGEMKRGRRPSRRVWPRWAGAVERCDRRGDSDGAARREKGDYAQLTAPSEALGLRASRDPKRPGPGTLGLPHGLSATSPGSGPWQWLRPKGRRGSP